MQNEKVNLESQLSKKDEENESLKTELDGAKIQNGELQSQLKESNSLLKETRDTENAIEAKKVDLLQQVQVATMAASGNGPGERAALQIA